MTPLTLFISVLLYISACLLPGGPQHEKKTGELQKVSEELQKSSSESTQEKHTQL